MAYNAFDDDEYLDYEDAQDDSANSPLAKEYKRKMDEENAEPALTLVDYSQDEYNPKANGFNESGEKLEEVLAREDEKKEPKNILNIKEKKGVITGVEDSVDEETPKKLADKKKADENKVELTEEKTDKKKDIEQEKTDAKLKEANDKANAEFERKKKREDLLKMSGINYKANDKIAEQQAQAKKDNEAKSERFNELAKRGNIAFAGGEGGGNIVEQFEVLSELSKLGVADATKRLQKMENNPYYIKEYNAAVAQERENNNAEREAARNQQAAKEAARKEDLENKKFNLDERKQNFAEGEAKQTREEKKIEDAQKAAAAKEQQEYERSKDKRDFDMRKATFEEKYTVPDKEHVLDLATTARDNIYNNALERTLNDSISRLGVEGAVKNLTDDPTTFMAQIENAAIRDKKKWQGDIDKFAKLKNIESAEIPSLDTEKLQEDLKLIGPKELDKLKAYGSDIKGAIKFISQIVSSVRGGAGFAGDNGQPFEASFQRPKTTFPPRRRNVIDLGD